MSSLNKAMIIGHLGADPEIRNTQSGKAVANFSVATSRRFKDKNGEYQEDTEWHKIVAWGRTAEIVEQYVTKGSKVYVEGPLKTNKWEDKDGTTRYTTEITALVLTMLGGDGQVSASQQAGRQRNDPPPDPAKNQDVFDDMDDDLPF